MDGFVICIIILENKLNGGLLLLLFYKLIWLDYLLIVSYNYSYQASIILIIKLIWLLILWFCFSFCHMHSIFICSFVKFKWIKLRIYNFLIGGLIFKVIT